MAERELTQEECTRTSLFVLALLGADEETRRAVRERCERSAGDARAALDAINESLLRVAMLAPF